LAPALAPACPPRLTVPPALEPLALVPPVLEPLMLGVVPPVVVPALVLPGRRRARALCPPPPLPDAGRPCGTDPSSLEHATAATTVAKPKTPHAAN